MSKKTKNKRALEEVFWSCSQGIAAEKELVPLVAEDVMTLIKKQGCVARIFGVGRNGHAILMLTNVLENESIGEAFQAAWNYYEGAIPTEK